MATVDGYGSGSIITPEAVLLDFELAGLGSRALAYAIDFVVQVMALMAFAFVVGFIGLASNLIALIVMLVGLILIVLGYPTLMETFGQGRTLGRRVVGTRVVTTEGAPVRFRHAFLRALLGIVDLLATAGAVAVAVSLVTKRGQRLGDIVAGTMVIRESKTSSSHLGALTFWPPTYLREWSTTLETQGLGSDVYQLLRDFLTRPDFDDTQKLLVAEDLAALVSERLPHAARTPAVPAMDYLLAVATAAQGPVAAPPPPSPAARRTGFVPPPPTAARPTGVPAAPRPPAAAPVSPAPPAHSPAVATGLPPGVPRAPGQAAAFQAPAPIAADPLSPPVNPAEAPDDGGFAAPG